MHQEWINQWIMVLWQSLGCSFLRNLNCMLAVVLQVLPNRMDPSTAMWRGGAVSKDSTLPSLISWPSLYAEGSHSVCYHFFSCHSPAWNNCSRLTFRLYDFTKKLFVRFSSGLEGGLHDKGTDGWIKVHFVWTCFFCCGWQVLAVLDSGRDLWVQYEDWMDGGVGVGTGWKYRDSNTLHSQAFWYNAMLDWGG